MHSQILIIYLCCCFINCQKGEIILVNNSFFLYLSIYKTIAYEFNFFYKYVKNRILSFKEKNNGFGLNCMKISRMKLG
jgi:hypothetical protein